MLSSHIYFMNLAAHVSKCHTVYLYRYSFDYGSVHFMMMSTEHNFTEGSPQYKWMEDDLKNVNRTLTPWIVIAGHRAMYTSQIQFGELRLLKFIHCCRHTVKPH